MTANYLQRGEMIDHIPATSLARGAVVFQGSLAGVASNSIPTGRLGALMIAGIFRIPRATGAPTTTGTRLYWDEVNQVVTEDDNSAANPSIGLAARDAAADDATIAVLLNS